MVEYDSEEQAPLLKGGKRLSNDSEIIEVIERKRCALAVLQSNLRE